MPLQIEGVTFTSIISTGILLTSWYITGITLIKPSSMISNAILSDSDSGRVAGSCLTVKASPVADDSAVLDGMLTRLLSRTETGVKASLCSA